MLNVEDLHYCEFSIVTVAEAPTSRTQLRVPKGFATKVSPSGSSLQFPSMMSRYSYLPGLSISFSAQRPPPMFFKGAADGCQLLKDPAKETCSALGKRR